VDSTQLSGTDSVFYLNRVVKDVPGNPEIVLRNQPQFLMEMMVREIYGIYSFIFPNHYFIGTQFGIGSSWTFDMTNNIDAEVTELLTENIFGIQDSVKVISLSDGNEILLSKNFGIIKFPDFENEGYYELVGLQNTAYGESVPDFWGIFDFEVGDVFQYHYNILETADEWNEIQKYRVDSKVVTPNSIEYQFYKIVNGYYIGWMGGGYEEYSYSENVNISYFDSINHPCNNFNNELIRMWEDYSGYYLNDFPLSRTTLHKDSIGNTIKKIGMNEDGGNLYNEIGIENDTLMQDNQFFCFNITYTEELGTTLYCFFYFEYLIGYSIQGYIKDGDTVGTITPDSLLLVGYIENKHKNNITVYPNPANNILNIDQLESSTPYSFELRNLYGQLVREENNIQSSCYVMNVADLKAGVYFYVIRENDKIMQQGKVIVK